MTNFLNKRAQSIIPIKFLIIIGLLFSLLSCSDNASDKETLIVFDENISAMLITARCFDLKKVKVCQDALKDMKMVDDPDPIHIAGILNKLAYAYLQENNFEKSEPLYIESLEIAKKTLEPNDITLLEFKNDLGTLYLSMGKTDKAIELFKQSLEWAEVNLSTNAPEFIVFLSDLSSGYVKTANYWEAEKLSKRALKIAEKPDPAYPRITEPIESLARVYRNQEKFAEAKSLLNKSLEITERNLGPKHIAVAQIQLDLAKVSYSSGKITEVEALLKSALKICLEDLSRPGRSETARTSPNYSGTSHKEAAKILPDFKDLYTKIGNVEEAAKIEDILKEAGETIFSNVKRRLKEGYYIKADGDCRDILKFTEEELTFDYKYGSIATILIDIGSEYNQQGKYDEAEPFLKCSLEVMEKATELTPSQLPLALNELSVVYLQQKKHDDATPLTKRALKMAETNLEPDDPLLATILFNLALLYRSQLKIKKATPLLLRSIEIREKILNVNDPELGDSLALMGLLYGLQNNYNEATLYLERGFKIWKITRSADDPVVLAAYKTLGNYYNESGKPEEAARVEAYLNKHGLKVEEKE